MDASVRRLPRWRHRARSISGFRAISYGRLGPAVDRWPPEWLRLTVPSCRSVAAAH